MKMKKTNDGYGIFNEKELKIIHIIIAIYLVILALAFPLLLVGVYLFTKSAFIAVLSTVLTFLPMFVLVGIEENTKGSIGYKTKTKEEILKEISDYLDEK